MLPISDVWMEFARFACEVQSVIAMRLVRIAQGGPTAGLEAQRMIAEKFDALVEAEAAMGDALVHGEELMVAAERAYEPVRERVHANNRRLMAEAA